MDWIGKSFLVKSLNVKIWLMCNFEINGYLWKKKKSMDSLGIFEMRIVFGKIASMVSFGNLTRGYIGK